MDFDEIADELHALTPTELTPARDEASDRARQAGGRPLAQQIRRAAQEDLAAPELRGLRFQRRHPPCDKRQSYPRCAAPATARTQSPVTMACRAATWHNWR